MNTTLNSTTFEQLRQVIDGGYCIGCGACTLGLSDSKISVRLDAFGRLQATSDSDTGLDPRSAIVCPFSDSSLNEDELAKEFLNSPGIRHDPRMGRYLSIHVGHIATNDFRARGSSGGFTSWILAELIRNDLVDAVVHVKPNAPSANDRRLFRYGISTSVAELQQGAKSHYYPVEMSDVLQQIRNTPGRYAVVGVPCFIKALRLLARKDDLFRGRITFTVGLFCGHLKSTGFSEMLSWQCGVHPDNLHAIDFRTKLEDRPSSRYGITVEGLVDGHKVKKTMAVADLEGTDWGMGFFKYSACDYCDDISAETADVSVGDAWLPEFTSDFRGTNVIIVRHPRVLDLVKIGIHDGHLSMGPLDMDLAVKSQSANFRHRREDLPYRLHLKDLAHQWRPKKRVEAAQISDPLRREIQKHRIRFREQVPLLWQATLAARSIHHFLESVSPLVREYRSLYATHTNTRRGFRHYITRSIRRCLSFFR